MSQCGSFNTFYLGEDKDLPFRITKDNGTPFDLTGAQEIEFLFESNGTNPISKKLSVGATEVEVNDALTGLVTAKLVNTDTSLKVGSKQTVWVKITGSSGKVSIVKADDALTVEKPF